MARNLGFKTKNWNTRNDILMTHSGKTLRDRIRREDIRKQLKKHSWLGYIQSYQQQWFQHVKWLTRIFNKPACGDQKVENSHNQEGLKNFAYHPSWILCYIYYLYYYYYYYYYKNNTSLQITINAKTISAICTNK